VKVEDGQGFVDILELSPKLDYLKRLGVTFNGIYTRL